MTTVADAVESSSPLTLLQLVSSIASIELRQRDPFVKAAPTAAPTFDELLETFMEVSVPETSAILAVASTIHPDELFRARAKRELIERGHRLPGWLRQLDLSVTGAERTTDKFGDGENIALGVRIGTSHEFTIVVYVDHQAGTVVKDAFIVEMSLTDTMLNMLATEGADELSFTTIDRADARARLEGAVAGGAQIWPPFETEQWPAIRPLLSWVLATMPTGGTSWERREWSDDELSQLESEFFESPHARGLDGPDDRDIVGTLLMFGASSGVGHPLKWSPVSIEILLFDRIPRKVFADASYLVRIPDVLRTFIRFAHERSGLDASLTSESMVAMDRFVGEYRELIDIPARFDAKEMLRRTATSPWLAEEHDPADRIDFGSYMLETMAEEVGGLEALWSLDARPLSVTEDFSHDGLSADIIEAVERVRVLLDDVVVQVPEVGVELRTVCRRLLHDIAEGDPQIFRRKSSPARTAAAVAWIAAKANWIVGFGGFLATQDLLAAFDVTGSVSQRATPMQLAIGVDPHRQYGAMNLGTVRYLTSFRRDGLIVARDLYEARRIADLQADGP